MSRHGDLGPETGSIRIESWMAWSRGPMAESLRAFVDDATMRDIFNAGFNLAAQETAARILAVFEANASDQDFRQQVRDEYGLNPKGRHR